VDATNSATYCKAFQTYLRAITVASLSPHESGGTTHQGITGTLK
jgi:hypothetical protein